MRPSSFVCNWSCGNCPDDDSAPTTTSSTTACADASTQCAVFISSLPEFCATDTNGACKLSCGNCPDGSTPTAEAAPYYLSASPCPVGAQVTYETECQAAAEAVGLAFDGALALRDGYGVPGGCYKDEVANSAYFNNALAATGSEGYVAVCAGPRTNPETGGVRRLSLAQAPQPPVYV